MPRIYNATFQPFTYDELATPIREMTLAHQKVEEDYNNNMLVVDSLRQRAANEPDAKWAKQITDYANQLEGYAMDLARNGLTRETRGNLLNMKRGYGTTVSPVLMAMLREKELQSVRDKNPDIRNVFSTMPTIDLIIANPNIGLNWYSGSEIFNEAQALADAASKRNVDSRVPENISNIFYRYGKTTGFTNEEIADIEKNPVLGPILQRVYQKYGWNRDFDEGSRESNQLKNEAITGMMAGVSYNEDWHYGQRPDYHDPKYWLEYEKLNRELHPEQYQTNTGFQNGVPTPKRPTLMFGHSVDPKKQKENDVQRNNMINDKNIVTNIQHTVDGDIYEISQDYVKNILNGINGKTKVSNWSLGNASPFGGPTSDPKANNIAEQLRLAKMFGITKDDTVESATLKILNLLEDKADYTDLSDATLHTAFQVKIDPSDYGKVRDNYDGLDGNLNKLVQKEDGTWVSSGKKLENSNDYNPIRVDLGLNGVVQVWKKNNSSKSGDDIIYTPFFNKTYGDLIYSNYINGPVELNKEYNRRNNNEATTIRSTIDYNINQFDENVLKQATRSKRNPEGYTKGDIIRIVKNTPNNTKGNRDLVEFINLIEQSYYTVLQNYYSSLYNGGLLTQNVIDGYKLATNRLGNANNRILFMNNIIDEIDEAASNSKLDIMDVIAPTAKTQPEQYGGGNFKND